ncbi:MAG TPA: hypothetical protein VG591_11080 [Burkholderiales bacterium]|jgi:hypothetical protein|nr:hypothetical protein [Burkholderiales bacterium]
MKKETRNPAKRIFDPSFRYRPSHETDIRETFERVRREQGSASKEATEELPLRKNQG